MDPTTVATVFATVVIVGLVATIAALFVPTGRELLRSHAPKVVAIAAGGATLGSLYFSEVADYLPCTLCWYQRIAMYPIALVAVGGLVFRDQGTLRSSLGLAAIGLAIAVYHIQLQLFPDQGSSSCEIRNPCTAKWAEAYGFISIPMMAGACFAIIVAASVIGLRRPAA